MPLRPRKTIAGLESCVHGGIDYAELKALGIDPDDILDFSVCTNPFMPPPGIKKKLGAIPIERYPDSRSTELLERISERLDIPTDNILVGSGTTELIRLIALTYFRQRDAVLLLEPTYGEYEVASRLAEASLIRYRATVRNKYAPRIEKVVKLIRQNRPRAVFICNPNNPTGKYLSQEDIEEILDVMGDGLLILDEAYIDFVEKTWNSLELTKHGNVVVLRSMTKNYGLPGLRLGYAVASREIIESLRITAPPWNVNAIAQKVAITVLEQEEYLKQSLRQVLEGKSLLVTELTGLGFKVLPSDANYFLVRVGNAAEFRRVLLKERILVRDCTSFGMPEYVRISPRTMPECERLIAAVGSLTKSGMI